MAFYKKFTPKKDPKISFGQSRERKYNRNHSDNMTGDISNEPGKNIRHSNSLKPGDYKPTGNYNNKTTGEGRSNSKPYNSRKTYGSNENSQKSGENRYNSRKSFSPTDRRSSFGQQSENLNLKSSYHQDISAKPSNNTGKPVYERGADNRGNQNTHRNTPSNSFNDRRYASHDNKGPFGRPGDQRNPSFIKPSGSRGPYGRPAENSSITPSKSSGNQSFTQNQVSFTPTAYELPENLLSGRNPIREALKVGRDIEKLMVASGELSGSAREIMAMAKNAGIIVQTVERTRLDQITRNHQGMIAFTSAFPYADLDEILNVAKQRNEPPFIVILDKITDPMNLGAIIRSAACAGAHGVIVQQHRAVGLTPSAVRASAGGVEHVKVARVTNINQTIRDLKKMGIWIYASDAKGEDYRNVNFSGACALIIGSEGEGVSQLTLELSDQTVSIPMSGVIDSLNASVAAGILMYAVYTGRDSKL